MARGLERPPIWAVIVMALGTVAVVVLGVLASGRGELSAAEVQRLNDTIQAEREQRQADVLVIGDSYTAGSDEGGVGGASWTSLLDSDLRAAGYDPQVTVAAAGGSGYVNRGPEDVTFPELVQGARDGDYRVVVFFGSRNDNSLTQDVVGAAREAFGTARERWPDAELLVIGPPWVDGTRPPGIVALRDALAAVAADFDATFVDPLAEGWFDGAASGLIGSDGVHPTDNGHRYMADLILPRVVELLPDLP